MLIFSDKINPNPVYEEQHFLFLFLAITFVGPVMHKENFTFLVKFEFGVMDLRL